MIDFRVREIKKKEEKQHTPSNKSLMHLENDSNIQAVLEFADQT
jgi:hypothetical protein